MLDHWQLQRNPFAANMQRDLFGANAEEALSRMLFVIEQGHRCGAVTGPAQIGKSRLLQEVRQCITGPNSITIHVDAAGLSGEELVDALARRCSVTRRGRAWDRLTDALYGWQACGLRSVWLLDDVDQAADELSHDVLRLIKLLDRTGAAGSVVIAAREVTQSKWPALDLSVALEPWTAAECAEFVSQRLQWGMARRSVFSPDGLNALAEVSAGIPGALIRLCDLALHAGWILGANVIDAQLVRSIAGEMRFSNLLDRTLTLPAARQDTHAAECEV